jgi:hypothetical protein
MANKMIIIIKRSCNNFNNLIIFLQNFILKNISDLGRLFIDNKHGCIKPTIHLCEFFLIFPKLNHK